VGPRFPALVQTGPGAHSTSCRMDTGSFLGAKSDRGVTLTTHPFLVLWSRKIRAIPLLPLLAVRPVESLSACTRVHFTFLPCILPFTVHFTFYSAFYLFTVHFNFLQWTSPFYNGLYLLHCILLFYIFFKQYEPYKKVQAAVNTQKMRSHFSSYHKNKALSTTGLRSEGAANLLLTRVDMNKKV
jgi:hypothetical protein